MMVFYFWIFISVLWMPQGFIYPTTRGGGLFLFIRFYLSVFICPFLFVCFYLSVFICLLLFVRQHGGGLVAHSSRITDSARPPSIGTNLPIAGKENLWALSHENLLSHTIAQCGERSKQTYQEKFGGYWENLKKEAGVYWVRPNIGLLPSHQFLLSAPTLLSHYLKHQT